MKNKPNVILMFVDDLGYGDLSCYNENSKIQTPNIDDLCKNGVRFTDCHATSALCTPSRYGLLTGRYNWRSRLKRAVLPGGAEPLIEPGRMTLGNLFQDNGYFTAAVGKWHLGLGWNRLNLGKSGNDNAFAKDGQDLDFTKDLRISPNDFGFDYFFGTAASLDQPPYVYIENHKLLGVPDHLTGEPNLNRLDASMQDKWQRGPAVADYDFQSVIKDMNNKVLSLIDEHADEPFFIYYPTHAVHGPLLPPEEFKGKSGLNPYGDMVLYVDYLVSTITEKLKEKGIWDNTIFIFASDNGCSGVADYPLLLGKGHNPSYVFRGHKSDIWEGGHRIPAIISWPKEYKDARAYSGMSCLCDLFATFADMFETKVPSDAAEDSISFKKALKDNEEYRKYVVHSSGMGKFSIRSKDWKLENCAGGAGFSEEFGIVTLPSDAFPYQLYLLTEDIGEKNNLAQRYPEACLEMTNELLNIIENGRSNEGPKAENENEENWEQLKELKEMYQNMLKAVKE